MPLTSKPSPLFMTHCSLFSLKSFLTTYISLTLLFYDHLGECSSEGGPDSECHQGWGVASGWGAGSAVLSASSMLPAEVSRKEPMVLEAG